jgi:hypothetical protein
VGGKPTVQFSGANVQVVNGTGTTESANGEGNLVVGYDEDLAGHPQTGSHNLILGVEQMFTSYGGLAAGSENFVTGPWASVTGGANEASGDYSSVSGGGFNIASGRTSSISGGEHNTTPTRSALIGGGAKNETFSKGVFLEEGVAASIFGGKENKTAISYGAIPGYVLPGVSGEHC